MTGGYADMYKATYKGQPVVAKALKTTSLDSLEIIHKVRGPILVARSAHEAFSAFGRGGCSVEMASA